jgi:hypothetical protein
MSANRKFHLVNKARGGTVAYSVLVSGSKRTISALGWEVHPLIEIVERFNLMDNDLSS